MHRTRSPSRQFCLRVEEGHRSEWREGRQKCQVWSALNRWTPWLHDWKVTPWSTRAFHSVLGPLLSYLDTAGWQHKQSCAVKKLTRLLRNSVWKTLPYLALKSCLNMVKLCVNLSLFLDSSVRVTSAMSLSKQPASRRCWSGGWVARIWDFRPLKICSLIRMRESIGLLRLHWLEQSSNNTISNRDLRISGNRFGHSAMCLAMFTAAADVGVSSMVILLK